MCVATDLYSCVLICVALSILPEQMSNPLKKGGVDTQDSSLFGPLREALNVSPLDEQIPDSVISTNPTLEYDPSSINLTIYTTSFNDIFPCPLSKKYLNSAHVTMFPTSSHNLFDAYLTVDTQAEAEAFVRESRAYIASMSNPPHAIYYTTSDYPMIATKDVLPTCVLDIPAQYTATKKPMDEKTKYIRSLYLPHPVLSLSVPTTVNYALDAHTEISTTVVGVCMLATSAACLAIMRRAARTPLLRHNLSKLSSATVRRIYARWAHTRLFAGMSALLTPGLLPFLLLRAEMREGFAREAGEVSLEQSFTRPVMVVNREDDTALETGISLTMRVPVHEGRVAENALAMTLLTLLLVAVLYPVTTRLVLRRMDQHDARAHADQSPPDAAAEADALEPPPEVPPGFTHAVRAHIPLVDRPDRLPVPRVPVGSPAWTRVHFPLHPLPTLPSLAAGSGAAPSGSLIPLPPLVHDAHERIARGAPLPPTAAIMSTSSTHPVPRISATSTPAPLPAPAPTPAPPVQAVEAAEAPPHEPSVEAEAGATPAAHAPEQSLSASPAPERREVYSTYAPRMHPPTTTLSISHPLPLPHTATGLDAATASAVAAAVGAAGTRVALPPPPVLYRYDALGDRVAVATSAPPSLRARVATWASQLLGTVKGAFTRTATPLASATSAVRPATATTAATAPPRFSLRDLYRGSLPYHGTALLLLLHLSAHEYVVRELRPVEQQPLRKLFETDTFRRSWLLSLPAVLASSLLAYPLINAPTRNAFHQRMGVRPWALAGFTPFFARMLLMYTLAAKMLHRADATGAAKERAVIRAGYPAQLSALLPPPPAPPKGFTATGARHGSSAPSAAEHSAGPRWWEIYLRGVRPTNAPTPADVHVLRQYAQECSKHAYWHRHPERYVEDEQVVVLNKTNTLQVGDKVTYVRHMGSPQTQTDFSDMFDLAWAWLTREDE